MSWKIQRWKKTFISQCILWNNTHSASSGTAFSTPASRNVMFPRWRTAEVALIISNWSSLDIPMAFMASRTSAQSCLSSVPSTWGWKIYYIKLCFLLSTYICCVKISVIVNVSNSAIITNVLVGSKTHLVEDVEVSFSRVLADNTWLFKKEVRDLTSSWLTSIK